MITLSNVAHSMQYLVAMQKHSVSWYSTRVGIQYEYSNSNSFVSLAEIHVLYKTMLLQTFSAGTSTYSSCNLPIIFYHKNLCYIFLFQRIRHQILIFLSYSISILTKLPKFFLFIFSPLFRIIFRRIHNITIINRNNRFCEFKMRDLRQSFSTIFTFILPLMTRPAGLLLKEEKKM